MVPPDDGTPFYILDRRRPDNLHRIILDSLVKTKLNVSGGYRTPTSQFVDHAFVNFLQIILILLLLSANKLNCILFFKSLHSL